ncbi:MAG: hypothetical protein DRJ35_05130 [Thermoprotei archaeon]|nr:MAG: hypothetical protein DRJ35_05130 [Thermoprotei archaeon]
MSEKFEEYEKALSRKSRKEIYAVEKKGDVKASGAVRIVGGKYNVVKVSGAFRCDGDLEANEVKISGSASINGSLKASVIKVSGAMSVNGDIEGGQISISGALKAHGTIQGGEVKVAGGISSEEIIGGVLKIAGGIKAQRIVGKNVVIRVSDKVKTNEIVGDIIDIEGSEGFAINILNIIKISRRRKAEVEVSDKIKAKLLKLRNVIIRGDVEADRIELYENARILGNVKGEMVKMT